VRPRLLDLFCKAGGASMGYHRAGFEVVGVDIEPQPHYPFEFHQADAMTYPLDGFDAIHASPPCQAYSSATKAWGRQAEHPDLLPAVRRRLLTSASPWAIENVEGAPVHHGVVLCGSMFGLGVERHRWFETSHLLMMGLRCEHTGRSLTVTGHSPYWWAQGARKKASSQDIARAMGVDWMNRREIVQAIPPAYTEFIGAHLLEALRA
jgi:DNA (cytosine-5)-methyltransferase 1